MIRSLTRAQLVIDIVVAGVFFVFVSLVGSAEAFVTDPGTALLKVSVGVLLSASLAVRRLSPALALCGAWAGAILQMATVLPSPVGDDLAILGVLYATGSYGRSTVRWLGLASAGVGGILAAVYLALVDPSGALSPVGGPAHSALVIAFYSVGLITLLGLSWTLGLLARTMRQSREAKLQAAVAAQRASYESAIEQERTQIARDMHDVVAHSLAVVIAQADGARYSAAVHPELQTDALATIAQTARSALADVRLLLEQLRREVPDGPQHSLEDLDDLIAGMRKAGLRITEVRSGTPAPLLQGSGLAAYRILQEALTNALRHGDPLRTVGVEVAWEPQALRLRVRNAVAPHLGPNESDGGQGRESGQGPEGKAARRRGHGLPGMRERAALAGGTLTAGPVAAPTETGTERTFVVTAVLPTAHDPEVVS